MKLLKFFIVAFVCLVPARVLAQTNIVPDIDEFTALKALWDNTNGASWTNKTGWPTAGNWPSSATSAQMAGWYGVSVQSGDVQVLNLSSNNLTGIVPTQINLLKRLRNLSLSSNSLTSLPQDLTGLIALESLTAGSNYLEGPLPIIKDNLPNLSQIGLNFNRFTGGIPISYTTAPNMQYLILHDNYLSGSLPPQLGNLTKLVRLLIQNNRFTGSIPAEFGTMVKLETLYLFNNQLSGELPASLAGMVKIIWFYVHQNNLSGTIPSIFSPMSNLYGLSLRDNKFSGPLPDVRGSQIEVHNNSFSGAFPTMATNAAIINASNNKFTSIPSAITSCPALSILNFQNNELTSLPAGFLMHSNKTNMQLLLQNNQLDFGLLETILVGTTEFKTNSVLMAQKTIKDVTTQTLVVGNSLVLTTRPKGSATTITWEKLNGSTWSAVSDDQDSNQETYTRTSATESNEGVYRWKSTSAGRFSGYTIQSDPITVKTAAHFTVDNLSFQYKYDGRKRMTHKRVPGADWVYMVYDNRDRLVLTQDGNQRVNNLWSFTKYDQLNRPILMGVKDTTVALTQEAMQTVVNSYYNKGSARWFESLGGTVHGYTTKSYPVLNDIYKYLTVTYYDDYTWKSTIDNNTRLDFKINELPGEQATAFLSSVRGAVTGNKVKVLDGGTWGGTTWLVSASYYDADLRVIQNVADNYKGGTDRLTNVLDFVGRVTKSKATYESYDVNWKDRIAVSVTGNKLGSIQTTSGYGLSGAGSTQVLAANADGSIEVTVGDQDAKGWVVGLSSSNPNAQEASIQFGVGVNTAGYVAVTKTTTHQSTGVFGLKGDVLKITRSNGVIRFYKNNVEISPSENNTSALMVDAALYYPTSSFSNLKASFARSEEVVVKEFLYDHTGRLMKVWHTYNSEPKVLMVTNVYNEIGQLIDKKLHSSDNGSTGKQSIDYRYNIRGWLTSINGSTLDATSINDDPGGQARDLFGMYLHYYSGEVGLGNAVRYNGNISAMTWSNNLGLGANKQNSYVYTYDRLNRITSASFKQKTTGWQSNATGAYNETGYKYDFNGNILSLTRKGKNGSLMDSLVYDYGSGVNKSNRLLKVSDSADKANGFKDGVNFDDDYSYDTNGNMIVDQNKSLGVAGNMIRYNLLNLPEYINRGGASLHYAYDATGRKLSQTAVFIGSSSKKTDYNGELVYENDQLSQLNTDEGRVVVSTPKLIYSNSGEQVGSVTTSHASVAITTMAGGEKYFDVTASNTAANAGLFPIADGIPVFAGEQYLIKAKGYESNALIAYITVKLNGAVIDGLSAGLPNKDGSESWTEQLVTIKEDGTLQAGVTWPTPISGQKFYLNEFEVYKIESTTPEYQYHLKDHLGNVRMTFTTKDEVETVKATVEIDNETTEASQFLNYDRSRKVNHKILDKTYGVGTAPDGSAYAIRLNGSENEKIGLAKSLSVMPGDVLKVEVYAKYYLPPADPQDAFAILMAQVMAGAKPAGVIEDGVLYGSNWTTSVPGGVLAGKTSETGAAPKAYLNWLVFDKDYNLIVSKSNYKRISTQAQEDGSDITHERLAPASDILIEEPGYVYIYLSNENPQPVEVYFDDFKVEHIKSPVIESQSFYPFGLTFDHYQRENSTWNKFLYNQGAGDKKFNSERVVELDLNVDQSKYRTLDYITGRWWQVDPKGDAGGQENWSTYQFGFDNPIRYNDPEGDCIPFCGLIDKYNAMKTSFGTPSTQGALKKVITNRSGETEGKVGVSNSATPDGNNKAISTISDAKTVTDATAQNLKITTNEVSKDVLETAKTVGTVMEFTPLRKQGEILGTTAEVLDQARQVAFEDKSVTDAASDVATGAVIDKAVSGWGNTARSVAGGDNVVISTYESGMSNLFQWVAEKVTMYLRDDDKKK